MTSVFGLVEKFEILFDNKLENLENFKPPCDYPKFLRYPAPSA